MSGLLRRQESFNPAIVERSRSIAVNQTQVMVTHDPEAAAKGASVLYTDVWPVWGKRHKLLPEFNVSTPD